MHLMMYERKSRGAVSLFGLLIACTLVCVECTTLPQPEITSQACGGGIFVSGETGNISSPNYPNNYGNNRQCTWVVKTQTKKVIRVWFIDYNVEPDTSCVYDYLTVHVDNELLGGRKYCGVDKPRDFVTEAQSVTFFFKSDGSIQRTGFFISWKLLDACSTSNFTCWNGDCIPNSQRCDRVNNCGDDSDEIECTHNTSSNNAAAECGRPSVATNFPWDERIIGGNVAVQGAFPWQVMLVYSATQQHFCGGSIIARKWVVTAAHCTNRLTRPDDVIVYVGRHNYTGNDLEVSHNVEKYIIHERYFKWNLRADIAMFYLKTPIEYTAFIKPICLPNMNATFQLKPGSICIATGWGSLYPSKQVFPDHLRQVRVPIVKRSQCESLYEADGRGSIPLKTLCAGDVSNGGVDSCVGDSGGPLACLVSETAFYLFGITSFGQGCGDRSYPGVYTEAAAYNDWIQTVMQENDQENKSPDNANVPTTVAPMSETLSTSTQVTSATAQPVNTETTHTSSQTPPVVTTQRSTTATSPTSVTTSASTKATSTTSSNSETLTTGGTNATDNQRTPSVNLPLIAEKNTHSIDVWVNNVSPSTTVKAQSETITTDVDANSNESQLAPTVVSQPTVDLPTRVDEVSTGKVATTASYMPHSTFEASSTDVIANVSNVLSHIGREEPLVDDDSTTAAVRGTSTNGATCLDQHFHPNFIFQCFLVVFIHCF